MLLPVNNFQIIKLSNHQIASSAHPHIRISAHPSHTLIAFIPYLVLTLLAKIITYVTGGLNSLCIYRYSFKWTARKKIAPL